MKFALLCPCCLQRAILPGRSEDGSTFDQEAAIETFTVGHVEHLADDQTIQIIEVPSVSFGQFNPTRVLN